MNTAFLILAVDYAGCELALFMYAIEDGNTEVIELLIQQGADVNHRCGTGETPLLVAVRNDDIDTVNILIKYGADPNYVQKHSGQRTILMESRT